jgi:hypothetical protein
MYKYVIVLSVLMVMVDILKIHMQVRFHRGELMSVCLNIKDISEWSVCVRARARMLVFWRSFCTLGLFRR